MKYKKVESPPVQEQLLKHVENARQERKMLTALRLLERIAFRHGANNELRDIGVILGIQIDPTTKYAYDDGSLSALSRDLNLQLKDIPSHSMTIRITGGNRQGEIVSGVKVKNCEQLAPILKEKK